MRVASAGIDDNFYADDFHVRHIDNGAQHHQNFAMWVLVMFVPLVSLLAHLLMKGSNNYHPLFSCDDLNDFCVTTPLIYYGRAIFVAILMTFWLLAVVMIVEAYIYYRKTCATQLKAEDAEQRDGNVKLSIAWALVIIMGLVPWCISSLVLHIVYNLLIFGLLTIMEQVQEHVGILDLNSLII